LQRWTGKGPFSFDLEQTMQVAMKHRETSIHNPLNASKQAHIDTNPSFAKSPGLRAQELLEEAKAAAAEQIAALDAALVAVGTIADEIASGGEIYPDSVKDLCRRLNEEVDSRSKTIAVILKKTGSLAQFQSRHYSEN
jgi:hypothetical protein